VVLLAFAAVPTTAFLATQSFGEILALLLFLIAWNNFVAFARTGTTWKGFVAGLVIGLAFFVSLYALVYGLIFILSAPFYLYERGQGSFREQRERIITGTVVIAFPTVIVFLAWTYLCWLFTGNGFSYVRDVISPMAAFADSASAPMLGARAVLEASLYDVLRLPLYLVVGILTAIYAPHRFVTFLVPIVVITVTRALGWVYSEPFALATMTVVALAGIPLRRRGLGWLLVPAALLQIFFAYGLADRSVEQNVWRSALVTNAATAEDVREVGLANRLARLPPHSLLIDSGANHRLISRMGTALPLMDADNAAYQLAVSAPAERVDYILMTDGDEIAQRFAIAPPQGFILDTEWDGGQLYRNAKLP
jgi:hypothetical protein